MPHLAAPASPPPAPNLMSDAREAASSSPPSERGRRKAVVVVMGATGAGKSRLAVDLARHFAGVEVVSADSMQVYRGLDVLTNKVFLTISLASSILPWSSLAYYRRYIGSWRPACCCWWHKLLYTGLATDDVRSGYEHLKEIDPIAAQRIHPNNHRKIKRYLELYATTGALPSDLFQGEAAEDKWGRPTSSRFDCCFLWVDAELHVLDNYVNERVDCMINAGLLDEVRNIYNPGAVYTQGLRQAIGVREFDEFFRLYFTKKEPDEIKAGMLDLHDDKLKSLLDEAVSQLKANTRRLVRLQRRRLHQLNKDFGWNLHHIDATEAFQCTTGDSWHVKVIKPCADTVRRFLSNDTTLASKDSTNDGGGTRLASRELWTQYVCEACDNRVLRGAHEWEQHKQGRGHRKRTQRLKRKSKIKSTSSEAEV
ncbi:tRNA dimethylallyltransferase 2 isoform X1 [Triticum aestivum]|uniref:tRNA dimethylallyltransferase 2 isoform X1 n=1 Tax=Triticum aestivum TaxID=4565 RepID=UPI001D028362|nr:tRNA dimethylallyltransferase 2-like isoform X1 [Triticum aestivum]